MIAAAYNENMNLTEYKEKWYPLSSYMFDIIDEIFKVKPVVLKPGIKTGLSLSVDNPLEVGADIIADCAYAKEIYGWIRGLSDQPGAYFLIDDLKLKVFKAEVINNNVVGQVGEIVRADKGGLVVQCKDGQLALQELQKEGKKRMDYKSFLNGNQGLLGKILK